MNKKNIPVYAALCCFALVFASCENVTLDTLYVDDTKNQNPEWLVDDEDFEFEEGPLGSDKRIVNLDSNAGACIGSDETKPGAVVATITLDAEYQPWTVELAEGYDDNHLFAVRPKNGETEENTVAYEVVVADGVTPLAFGPYDISVRMTSGTTTVNKRFCFEVTVAPAPFNRAPSVYPYIIGNDKNKLKVSWTTPSGSEGFNVYVGTSPDMPETPHKTIDGLDTTSIEITDIEGNDTQGVLPDGTTYYVWVEAYNDAGVSISPPVARTTSATILEAFYKDGDGRNFVSWDSFTGGSKPGEGGVDFYIVTPPTDNTPPRLQYGPERDGVLFGYRGDIVYHVAFDPQEAAEKAPHTQYGKYGDRLDGLPAGVFIVKYEKPMGTDKKRIYQGVYYWGVGHNNGASCYFSNSYGLASSGKKDGKFAGNPETATPEAAIDRFTLENMDEFIGYMAVPWVRNYKPYD
jgi:hypothetical protein